MTCLAYAVFTVIAVACTCGGEKRAAAAWMDHRRRERARQ